MSLTPRTQHTVCRGMWRSKLAALPWRGGGEMVTFWEAVVRRLAPDIRGDEGEDELRDMRRGYRALASVVLDLRSDREHPLARALVGRAGVHIGGVRSMPERWIWRVEEWVGGQLEQIRVDLGAASEEADVEWRREAIRRVIRKRKRGERVTYAEIADEMNKDPRKGRRPFLSAGGCGGRSRITGRMCARSQSLTPTPRATWTTRPSESATAFVTFPPVLSVFDKCRCSEAGCATTPRRLITNQHITKRPVYDKGPTFGCPAAAWSYAEKSRNDCSRAFLRDVSIAKN